MFELSKCSETRNVRLTRLIEISCGRIPQEAFLISVNKLYKTFNRMLRIQQCLQGKPSSLRTSSILPLQALLTLSLKVKNLKCNHQVLNILGNKHTIPPITLPLVQFVNSTKSCKIVTVLLKMWCPCMQPCNNELTSFWT